MNEFDSFKEKFRVDELLIYESEHWTWSLRPLQPTMGAGILALKRYAESFSEITEEEGKDLSVIIKVIEERLKQAFEYDKINYLMLMMVDPHVHFHIIARYQEPKEFAGVTLQDKGWPGPPSLEADKHSDQFLFAIQDKLK